VENVRKAGLEKRIELREQKGEDITDLNAFDLAWIPSTFIPDSAISKIAKSAHDALRVGGWVLFAMANSTTTDPLVSSLVQLRTAQWGGCLMSPGNAETLLSKAGFSEVQTLPSPPNALVVITAGRRT
jgi:hypothetical protein